MSLKHVFLTVALFVLWTSQNYAQTTFKPAIGVNLSDVTKDPANAKSSARVGWQLGGTLQFGRKAYLETGLFLTKKSTEFTEDVNDIKFNTDVTGLRIPLMVGYRLLGDEDSFGTFRVFGGGALSLVAKVNSPGLSKDDFNSPTGAVLFGAGFDVWLLFLDVNYEWSLGKISNSNSFEVGKSRSAFINSGIRINF